jgi:hypothetical protein
MANDLLLPLFGPSNSPSGLLAGGLIYKAFCRGKYGEKGSMGPLLGVNYEKLFY